MTLNYSLHDNVLTSRTDDMLAQAHPSAVYNREQFNDLIIYRGTMVTKTDIVAVFNDLEETAAYIIERGGSINLPLFNVGYSISGVFEGALDAFDPARHKVHVNVSKGTVIRDAAKRISPAKISTTSPQPDILEVKDSVTGSVDTLLTAGGAVEIAGNNIKVSGDNPAVGLYFITAADEEIKAETIIVNKPSQVIALIPTTLAAGMYRLKIATQYNGTHDRIDPKMTVYFKTLKVE